MAKTQAEFEAELSTLSGAVDTEVTTRQADEAATKSALDQLGVSQQELSAAQASLAQAQAAATPDFQAAFDSVAAVLNKLTPTVAA